MPDHFPKSEECFLIRFSDKIAPFVLMWTSAACSLDGKDADYSKRIKVSKAQRNGWYKVGEVLSEHKSETSKKSPYVEVKRRDD